MNGLATLSPSTTPGAEVSIPAASSTAAPSPQAPSALQCRNTSWSSTTNRGSFATVPAATTTASYSIDRVARNVRSTVSLARPLVSSPPTWATTCSTAPFASTALRSLPIPARSAPGPATTPTTRPATGPTSVVTCESAGEGTTPRAGSPSGAGRPSPAATLAHSSASTFASTPRTRSRIGFSKSLDSSNV